MKVITVCGSMRYKKEMIKVTEELALKGYCILAPIYQVTANIKINEKQKELLTYMSTSYFYSCVQYNS